MKKKFKHLVYGAVSTVAVIAPVAAVVSCGDNTTASSNPTTSPTTPTTNPTDTSTKPNNPSTSPSDTSTKPSDGNNTGTGGNTTTSPSNPSTSPSNPSTTPSDPSTKPIDGSTTVPSDPSTKPSDGSTTTPSDPSTKPSDGSTTTPSGPSTKPSDGSTTNPNSGSGTTIPPKVDPLVAYPFHSSGKYTAQSLSDESKRYQDNARWVGGIEYNSVISTISLLRAMAEKYGYTSDLDANNKSQREIDQASGVFVSSDGKVYGKPTTDQSKAIKAFTSFKQSKDPITKSISYAALGDEQGLTFDKLSAMNIISDYTLSQDVQDGVQLNTKGDASIASSLQIDWYSMYDDENNPDVMNIEMHDKNTDVTFELALKGVKDKYPVIPKKEFQANVIPYIKQALAGFAKLYTDNKALVNVAINGISGLIDPILRDRTIFKQVADLVNKLTVNGQITLDDKFDAYLSELNDSGTMHWTAIKAIYFGYDKSVATGLMAPFSVVGSDWDYKQSLNGLKDLAGFTEFQKWDHYTYFIKYETGSQYAFVPANTNFSTLPGHRISYIGNLSLVENLKAEGYSDADVTMLKKYINLREGRAIDYEDPAWAIPSPVDTKPAQPGDGSTTTPGNGSTTNPGTGTGTNPGGTTTTPGDGSTTTPGTGTGTNPGTTTPGDGTGTNPGTTTPGDGTGTNPGTTTPGENPATDPVIDPELAAKYPAHLDGKYSLASLTDESQRYQDGSRWVGGMEYHSFSEMVSLVRALSEKYGYTSAKDINGHSQRELDLPGWAGVALGANDPAGIFVLADGTVLGKPNTYQAQVIKTFKTLKQVDTAFDSSFNFAAYGDDGYLTYNKAMALHLQSDNTISSLGGDAWRFDTKGDSSLTNFLRINWYSTYDDPENPEITRIIMHDDVSNVVFEMALKGLKDKYPVIPKGEFKTNVVPTIRKAMESFLNFYSTRYSNFTGALGDGYGEQPDYVVLKQITFLLNKLRYHGKLTFDAQFDNYLSELNDKGIIHWTAVKAMYFGFDNTLTSGLMAPYAVSNNWGYNSSLSGLADTSSFADYRKWAHYNFLQKTSIDKAVIAIPWGTDFASYKGTRLAYIGNLTLEENLKASGYTDNDIKTLQTYIDFLDGKK